jgi:RNA polymerase sigma factor (sigma-70 family)
VTVEALRRGDPEILADLLERHGREIQGVAYLILRDRAEAEDVLMDTLVSALERGSSLRDPLALRAWLLRIATNHAISRRRRAARVLHLAVLPDIPVPAGGDHDRLVLLAALEALPLRARAAVVLRYYADLSVIDVAAAMGTSPNTVKTQLRRALESIRLGLEEPVVAGLPGEEVAHG